MGYTLETEKEVCHDFKVDLQDQACCRWNHREIQGKVRSTRLLIERRHRLHRDICTCGEVHFHRTILALVVVMKWKIHQIDVKTTF